MLRCDQQRKFIKKHKNKIIAAVQPHFAISTHDYCDFLTNLESYCDLPHPKKLLRQRAYESLLQSGVLGDVSQYLRKIHAKGKTNEFAKANKFLRLICDLGVEASLVGAEVMECLKTALTEAIYFGNVKLVFVKKPSFTALEAVFEDLMFGDSAYIFYYHSDDSCISIQTDTGIKTYNIDISSCDASHTGALFELMSEVVPLHCKEVVDVLIDQCKKPFEIRSTYDMSSPFKSNRVFKFTCDDPILPSGSTITTFINDLACVLMAYSFFLHQPKSDQQLTEAAGDCGYDITCDYCEKPSDIQFLKHSPVLTTEGKYAPLINAGVYFRTHGVSKGDFPGTGPIGDRYVAYQAALLQGIYPYVDNPFINAMKKKYKTKLDSKIDNDFVWKIGETRNISVSDAELFRRYDPISLESDLDLILSLRYGEIHRSDLSDAVFSKDYAY